MTRKPLVTGAPALALAAAVAMPSLALASAQDYRFELAGKPQAAPGGKSVVPVRLVHVPDNKPVADAVVFESRADMGPAGMPTMMAPIKALPPAKGASTPSRSSPRWPVPGRSRSRPRCRARPRPCAARSPPSWRSSVRLVSFGTAAPRSVLLGASILLAAFGGGAAAFAQSPPPGVDVEDLLALGRRLSPALREAALTTEAAAARASGADRLDDPVLSDGYTYYKDPNVFSGHSVMLTQAFPLWGKRGLRRRAALAEVDAARGRERAARDQLDEAIKVAYARYYIAARDIAVNREVAGLARGMAAAAAARYGQGGAGQLAAVQALGEETAAKAQAITVEGDKAAAAARLNALVGRPADAPLAEPLRPRPVPAAEPALAVLMERALGRNPALAASGADVAAARTRRALAAKAWYPDVTVGAGPLVQTNNRPVGFAATVALNIPLPWGREAAAQREAEAQLGASQQRLDAARLEVEGALGEALAKLRAARATEALLRREAMPQARAGFRALLAGYSQGGGELAPAIAAEHQVHEVELRMDHGKDSCVILTQRRPMGLPGWVASTCRAARRAAARAAC